MTVNIKRETKVELQFVVVCVIWGVGEETHAFVSMNFFAYYNRSHRNSLKCFLAVGCRGLLPEELCVVRFQFYCVNSTASSLTNENNH